MGMHQWFFVVRKADMRIMRKDHHSAPCPPDPDFPHLEKCVYGTSDFAQDLAERYREWIS